MIFSTALFIDAPHFLRTAGGLAPTCLFAGMGLDWMCVLVEQSVRNRWTRYVTPATVAVAMMWTGLHTYHGIWDVLATSDEAKIAWETSLRDFAESTAAAVDAQPLSPIYGQIGANSEFMRLDTQFLASRAAAWRWVAADQTMLPIPADRANGIIVVGDSELPLATVASQVIPGGKIDHTSPGTTHGDVKIPT